MVLGAVVVTVASLSQTPTYEASANVRLALQEQQGYGRIHPIPNPHEPETLRALTQTMAIVIETRRVVEEAIRRLGLEVSPDQLLDDLTVEQVESSRLLRLSYTDTDPGRAAQVVNTVGRVYSERVSVNSGANDMTATLYNKSSVHEAPASRKPWRNRLLALVVGLALIGVVATVRGLRRS